MEGVFVITADLQFCTGDPDRHITPPFWYILYILQAQDKVTLLNKVVEEGQVMPRVDGGLVVVRIAVCFFMYTLYILLPFVTCLSLASTEYHYVEAAVLEKQSVLQYIFL